MINSSNCGHLLRVEIQERNSRKKERTTTTITSKLYKESTHTPSNENQKSEISRKPATNTDKTDSHSRNLKKLEPMTINLK